MRKGGERDRRRNERGAGREVSKRKERKEKGRWEGSNG